MKGHTMSTIAPFSPTVSRKICATGSPVDVPIVLSRSWMEKSKPRIKNHPNTADTPMAITIPIAPDIAALCVSSVIFNESPHKIQPEKHRNPYSGTHMRTRVKSLASFRI